MQRRQTDESVTGAGRTVRILGARHERKCPLCDSLGSFRTGTMPHWQTFPHAQAAGLGVILLCLGRGEASRPLKKGDRKRSARSPPRGALATSQQSTNFSPPGRALKSSANLNGWIAQKPFEDLRRSTRARGSERHAEWDVRKPVKACRCWRSGGVSRRRQHERQASAHAPDVRDNFPSAASQ